MNKLGVEFEKQAEKYLKEKKFKIISKNYSCRTGEIDIIALKEDILHFVEVKARKDERFYHAAESVNTQKINKIRSASKYFLLNNPKYINYYMQFDLIVIIQEPSRIEYIPNCFY